MQKFSHLRRLSSKGAALVETALMLIFCLGLILGTYQIGYLSFVQLNLDSAAQITARMASLGYDPSTSATWAKQALPGLKGTTIVPGSLQNPGLVDLQGLSTATAGGSIGGFSFTIPFPSMSLINSNDSPVYIGSVKLPLTGFGIDSAIRELCPHVCSNGKQNTVGNSVLPFSAQSENTGPYFMSFNYMRACYSDTQTFDLLTAPIPPPATPTAPTWACTYQSGIFAVCTPTQVASAPTWDWQQCNNLNAANLLNSTQDLRALGTAAHLDATNSAYMRYGEDSISPPLMVAPPNPNDVGPFFETWCHRDIYVWLEANVFSKYPNYSDVTNGSFGTLGFLQQWMSPAGSTQSPLYPQPGAIIYSHGPGLQNRGWDVQPINGNTQYNVAHFPSLGTPWPWYGCGIYK